LCSVSKSAAYEHCAVVSLSKHFSKSAGSCEHRVLDTMETLAVLLTLAVVSIALVECGRNERLWPRDLGVGSGNYESATPASPESSTTPELTQSQATLEAESYPSTFQMITSYQTTSLPSMMAKIEFSSAMTPLAALPSSVTNSTEMPEATSTLSITATPVFSRRVTSEISATVTRTYPGVGAISFRTTPPLEKTPQLSMGVAPSSTAVISKLTSEVLVTYTETSSAAAATFQLSEVTVISGVQSPTLVRSLPLSTSALPTPHYNTYLTTKLAHIELTPTTPPEGVHTSPLSFKSLETATLPSLLPKPSNFFTSTLFLAAGGGGAAALLLVLVLLVSVLVACRKRMRRRCPCCRTSHKIEGPIISVSYRGSNQRERESYFNELGSTSAFYTRRGEDDASKEFFTTFFTTPCFSGPSNIPPADPVTYDEDPFTNVPPVTHYVDPVSRDHQQQKEVKGVKFKSLERSWKPSPQHQRKEGGEREEVEAIDDDFRLSDLENLEKVLDSALIRFETTTL
jgi:hypothetical protein